ncbi:hypothetical protein GYMLUDRAFT_74300 [Collybiopsis luxurians FD-317 M1]|uniref:PhoD-like phosphatase domain-containing protein n=1 Tax=Collybiopsis luxurians FD-317 M1 TaxID=944289 RepID=A0A0D0CV60_9AGAR|nr:hypothetical protein GYMLUDRAFT_74300 [Collybiopsis luxurians FD-317 M1]
MQEDEYFNSPLRGANGKYTPVEQPLGPLDEQFIGGFLPPPSPVPPPLPAKDEMYNDSAFHVGGNGIQKSISSSQLSRLSAVERSRTLRMARMDPHLQFMVGPLLRFDTIDDQGIWWGSALIVTADAGSTYEPHPTLTYQYDPDKLPHHKAKKNIGKSFDLGPHPADPHSTSLPLSASQINGSASAGPNFTSHQVAAQELWVYPGTGGTFTFWRFLIPIPLGTNEMEIEYSINHGQSLRFYVPGRNQNMRWASYSCNGFSAGVNPDDFRGPGFQTGYDPCWLDLLTHHRSEPFHVMVGGGDQLYCDGLTREPELQEWVAKLKPGEKQSYPVTTEISEAIDRFYFNHYCQTFRTGAFARANCSIPMMNMCDGFGSYPDSLQNSPIFRAIGSRGYFFFLLFQCFINVDIDGTDDKNHVNKSIIVGGPGPYVGFPSHSFLGCLGPQISILLLDCRAERTKNQVCSQAEYEKVFSRLAKLPSTVEHLVVQLGIPIAYPRMVALEKALESKFNPLVALGRNGSLGLSGFVNKFNAEAELLDDLNDHWTSRSHKAERNWLIGQLQTFAQARRIRVSFLSGDVHCAAVGVFKSLKDKNTPEIPASMDHRYMVNIVTSAIVNTPPPNAVIKLVASLASKTHKTMHKVQTDETMIPLFQQDPDGTSRGQKYIMGRRNWCITSFDENAGDLNFDIRVEIEKGGGRSKGYSVSAPAPRWERC